MLLSSIIFYATFCPSPKHGLTMGAVLAVVLLGELKKERINQGALSS